MPIQFGYEVRRIDEQRFYDIDYQVMGIAFDIHNEFGRLCNEKVYQKELANRCRKAGLLNVETEVPLNVSYKDFCKKYSVDLLVENSLPYELKAVEKVNSNHKSQALNYLFLLGLSRGKIINFRSSSVEWQFVSTTFLEEDRYKFEFNDKGWIQLDKDSFHLRELLAELIRDWGIYLDTNLFYQAIYHFRGGKDEVVKDINLFFDGKPLGKQKTHLLNSDTAFQITSFKKDINNYEQQLSKFIKLTKLKAIQWINFNRSKIVLKTILNPKK